MGIIHARRTFSLSSQDIDQFGDWFESQLELFGITRQNRLRTRLLSEDILLRMREHLGTGVLVTATTERGFLKHWLKFEAPSPSYNPLADVESSYGTWESTLQTVLSLGTQYSYRANTNIIQIELPMPRMNPVLLIAIALGIGALLGVLGSAGGPGDISHDIANLFLKPSLDVWIRVLNAISGPIVFCTVTTSMLNATIIDERGGSSVRIIVRYFVLSILVVVFSLIIWTLAFSESKLHLDTLRENLFSEMLVGLVALVPANMIDPIIKADTSQLLLLAFVLGCVLIKLRDRTNTITSFIREANVCGLQIASWVSTLVPLACGAFLCLELWNNSTDALYGIWKPLLASLTISLCVLFIRTCYLSARMHANPLLMIKKIARPFLIALRTGSLDESFAATSMSCIKRLGIEQNYTKVALPQGLVLYMPISAVGTIVFTLYSTAVFKVGGDLLWLISAVVMAVVIFVATPPVPGANLLAYVVLFETLGIPKTALLDAMIFDVVFGIFAGAANQAMLQLEMVGQAHKFGLIDLDRLRAQ